MTGGKSQSSRWIATSFALVSGVCLQAADSFKPNFPDDGLYLQGRYVYERNCVTCHGHRGDGKGDMAREMFPKPRPFKDGIFKYTTTPSGMLPTNADLERTIRLGIPGTSMPIFSNLTQRDVTAVAEYLKSFSTRWRKEQNYAPPLKVPEPPGWFDDESELKKRAVKGRELYSVTCTPCHGAKGEGDGPAVPTLKDAWDNPSQPANLRSGSLRNGENPMDLQRVLMKGIDGTPMASFREAIAVNQRWELVAFIQSLRTEAQATNSRP